MFTIELKKRNEENLYQQIYDFIKQEILNGKVSPHEKLPSKRMLAKNLGVSTLTVETAYSQLAAEGFIYSVPKKGFFAEKVAAAKHGAPLPKTENPVPEAEEKKTYAADFSGNGTDPKTYPFSVWAKIIRKILNEKQTEVMTPSPSQGIFRLRQAVAKHLHDFRAMSVSPEQIVIGAGTEYLYALLVQLLGLKKVYAVEEPCHNKIKKIYDSLGVKNVQIEMDAGGIIISGLKKSKADIVHISPSHHFPTGIIMPASRRYELLSWANQSEERVLLEDDYDSEFRFEGKPISTLQSIDTSEKVIYLNTFTKTLSPTVRISYMVLPPHLVEQFHKKIGFYSCTVPTIDQLTLAEFIMQGAFEKHINRMRKLYSLKKEIFLSGIKKYGPAGSLKIKEPASGLHLLLEVNKEYIKTFLENINENSIRIDALSNYYKTPTPESHRCFIVNYDSIPVEKIEQSAALLCGKKFSGSAEDKSRLQFPALRFL